MLPKPYYQEQGVTIYHGDAREILPLLDAVDAVITDPVWPNSAPTLIGADRPYELFAEVAALLVGKCNRLVVQLGCDSDPRFLMGVPPALPFFRLCWLENSCPIRKGRVLYNGDVAYAFGAPPPSMPGRRVISGKFISTRPDAARVKLTAHKEYGKPVDGLHPTPRRFEHVRWLVSRFAAGTILDPFMGSGTTLRAAKDLGYPCVGIEIEERFCEIAVRRMVQTVLPLAQP